MWIINHVKATNIVSFPDLDLYIEPEVATVITGENKDDQSQKVNGSGKSSIIEAIAIGITGSPLRKVKTEEFISDWADEASVELTLVNDYSSVTFVINRQFYRKGAQVIECHQYDEAGQEICQNKTVQPSVNDYNKFIMDEIGISTDDLFNNYILSKKYVSFFDSTDKAKKELINRFSNGVLVDQGIEQLNADLIPLEEKVKMSDNNMFRIKGSIQAVDNELASAEQRQEEIKRTKEQKIADYKQFILDKRAAIRETAELKAKASDRLEGLKELNEKVINLDKSNVSLIDAYDIVSKNFSENNLTGLSDYKSLVADYAEKITEADTKVGNLNKLMVSIKSELKSAKDKAADASSDCDDYIERFNLDVPAINDDIFKKNKQLDEMDKMFDDLEATINEKAGEIAAFDSQIARLNNILAGKISCPKCGHQFSLQTDKPISEVQSEVDDNISKKQSIVFEVGDIKKQKADKTKEYNAISDQIDELDRQLMKHKADKQKFIDKKNETKSLVYKIQSQVQDIESQLQAFQNNISKYEQKIDSLRSKLFDEADTILSSAISKGNNFISLQDEKIAGYNGNIEAYTNSIKALEESESNDLKSSLLESKKSYEQELEKALLELSKAEAERDELKHQNEIFLNFKAHLANTKLTAISQIVNNVLEEIGSNIRVDLQGYKLLKSGKLKETITVQLLKSGVDCGSFYKFSAGEQCRVNLASIIALQRLTNANCDEGKGLGLLIVDEILDSSDAVGLLSYCQTINKLRLTSLLITQNSLPENYPYTLTVVKENGMSNILTD